MTDYTKTGTIIKIKILQNSAAKNYFESRERYLLQTILEKLEKEKSDKNPMTCKESEEFKRIFEKYKRFVKKI